MIRQQAKKFRFEINGDAVDQKYLSINEKTGEIFLHKPVDREKHPCFYVSKKEIRPLFNKRTFNRKMIIPCCFNPQVLFDVHDTQTNLKIDKELAIIVDV